MKRWLVCSLTIVGVLVAFVGFLNAYEVANGFIFPINNYLEDDGCLAWGGYNDLFPGERHVGDDYCQPIGTIVRSIGKGRIKYICSGGSCGGWYAILVMEHTLPDNSKVCSIYGHSQELNGIQVGQDIDNAGIPIAEIIDYPLSSDHIHFGIYNGEFGATEGTYPFWLAGYVLTASWPGNYLHPVDFVNSYSLRYPVLDTSQSKCYNNSVEIACPTEGNPFYGQDHHYLGLLPDYENNGNGTVSVKAFDTVLMWEQGDVQNNSTRNWFSANSYCTNLTLAGYDDWRLPMFHELMSIVKFDGNSGPFINTTYFPNGKSNFYWTSTETGYSSNRVAVVGFNYASLNTASKTSTYYVRCIRGNEIPNGNFTDNGDATITDFTTGLTWQQADDGQVRNWEQALDYCQDLVIGERSDWRLPNILELVSIMDVSSYDPATDPVFIFTLTPPSNMREYWSGTTDTKFPNSAWQGEFKDGATIRRTKTDTNNSNFTRCVHD